MSVDKKIYVRAISSVIFVIIITLSVSVFTSYYFNVEQYTGFKKNFIVGISFVFGLFISATLFAYTSLIKIKNNIDNFVNKKFKQDVLSSVTESVISKVNADKTILKLQTYELEGLSYIDTIIKLHKSVNDNAVKSSMPFAFEILKNGTNKLSDFFDSKSDGGIYNINEAESLYGKLINECNNFFVVEPEFVNNYDEYYSLGYKDFINKCKKSKIDKSYIYSGTKPNNLSKKATIQWLKKNNFEVKFIDKLQAEKQINSKTIDWTNYSHLLFEYENFHISCSVLPILQPDEIIKDIKKYLNESNNINKTNLLNEINNYNINQNFNDSNLVYLSFWVGKKENGSSDNSFIRGLLNIVNSSKP